MTEASPVDNPSDNIFHVAIPESLCGDERVWLVYDLDGVEDHRSVSRSINDQLAVGGYLIRKRNGWAQQREQISAQWLRQGDNVVRFTLPADAEHSYRVKNIRFEVDRGAGTSPSIVHDATLAAQQQRIYIKGFVNTEGRVLKEVKIGGQNARVFGGEFETLIQSKATSANLPVEAIFTDGFSVCDQVNVEKSPASDYQYTLSYGVYSVEKFFPSGQSSTLVLRGASVSAPCDALQASAYLSITALRDRDIPALDAGMVNVTGNHDGFRFLPHGSTFNKGVNLHVPFDETKIPDGYTAEDIRTYFFDEQSHHWVALDRDTVVNGEVLSRSTHFTDMINGIIKVPESPETEAYNSTSIKGIKAANPTAAVNLINPPQANNSGNASFGYSFNIPAGRNGMQPQVGLSYNSGGGNGWVGLGWSMSLPMLTLDTRWGVPRYDASKETETYSLNGEQLLPVAHRGELQPRTAEKQFHPRVEGSFEKIVRHGDKPSNYWWEVTDKSGTVYRYGSLGGGVDKNSLLRTGEATDNGNIAQWCLTQVKDLNGNYVQYDYVKVQDEGIANGTVKGYQIYIKKISYTGHASSAPKYTVVFTRDRELNEAKRQDISIVANLGFKQVTADLLRKVEVQFEGKNIRRYELNYQPGAFYKTLLTSVSEFDAAGKAFNTHTFNYFNEVGTGASLKVFDNAMNWTPQSDDVHGNFINPLDAFNDKASSLSGTKSNDFGIGMAVTVGFNVDVVSKSLSVGGSFGYSQSTSEGLLSMIDINGDGLPDKVLVQGNTIKFRANLSKPGGSPSFGELQTIIGPGNFFKEKSKTINGGIEGHGPRYLPVFAGVGISKTKSITSVYFTEANGDQLTDMVVNGQVYFNHIDTNSKLPVFTINSNDTPSPIIQTGGVNGDIITPNPAELEQAIDESPLHDVVRMWTAPYSGRVSVQGAVHLIQNNDAERAETPADGVRVAIQVKGQELWSKTISATDYNVYNPTGTSNITVTKGDRLYFRVQSIFNGSYDQVNWTPQITYLSQDPAAIDANKKTIYRYTADKDFLLSAQQEVAAPFNGKVRIESNFKKPVTSDTVALQIIRTTDNGNNTTTIDTVWTKKYSWNTAVNEPVSMDVDVTDKQSLRFRIFSKTNIDWTALTWDPHVYYTASYTSNYPNVTDKNGNPLIEFYPVPEYTVYANELKATNGWRASNNTSSVTFTPNLAFVSPFVNGEVIFTVKKPNALVSKQAYKIVGGALQGVASNTIPIAKNDTLFFEFHFNDGALAAQYQTATATVNGATVEAGVHSVFSKNDDPIFGPLYRHWGQFAYNGNRERAAAPIDESLLKVSDQAKNQQPIDVNGMSGKDLEGKNTYDPSKEKFILMVPAISRVNNALVKSYVGYDKFTYVTASEISSSRMGDDDISITAPTAGARAIDKISKSTAYSYSIGASAGIFGASATHSEGDSKVLTDFADMNGDRYPDIVTEERIQYTSATGALSDNFVDHGKGETNVASTVSDGLSASGSFVLSKAEPSPKGKKPTFSIGGGGNSLGLSGNIGNATNETSATWMDINGDGLPDRVHKGGTVELNLGYSFAPAETWPVNQIQSGSSTSEGAGAGISIVNGSINAGIGLSRSDNEVGESLQDVNGDGLPDKVRTGNPMRVSLNTGGGFASEITWPGAAQISKSSSSGESANVAFTAGIYIPIASIKITINPSTNIGHGVTRETEKLSDVNGDGFPDYVKSSQDDQLVVALSTIGKTNLLKSVQRPLGANFAVKYQRVGNTYEMPNDAWVLSEVAVFDGFKGDGADSLKTTFAYEGGYYDRHEREFYGFKKVITNAINTQKNNEKYTIVTQTFNNDNYYEKGQLLTETMTDVNGNKFVEKENEYQAKDVDNNTTVSSAALQKFAGRVFPSLSRTYQRFYEGQSSPGKSTSSTYAYDNLGNVTNFTDYGDDKPDDDLNAVITYHNLPGNYIMATPKSITVTGNGKTYRKREAVIDSNTGDITQIKQYLESGDPAVHAMEYDAFGNLSKITRPANNEGKRLSMEYTYDSKVQTYVTKVSNSYGYSSEAEYDVRFGQLLKSKDLNGNEINYEIDNLGRVTKITGPYEKLNGSGFTIKFEYHPEAEVPWALTKHYDPSNPKNDLETSIFVDGLGRVLQTKKDAALYQGDGKLDKEVMVVSGRVIFDAFGRSTKAYYPITEDLGNQGIFNSSQDDVKPTEMTYDILNRALTVTLPDAAVTKTEYGFDGDKFGAKQFSTKTTDANGKQTQQFADVKGRVTSVKNITASKDVWTSFTYNAIGEQVEATDDMGNTTYSAYDLLGRRISRKHPDAGVSNYVYDLAGNLTQLETANLQKQGGAITYKYDFERLTDISYPLNPENNVHYTYGAAGATDNRAGRIVVQEDASGAQEFFYGPLGEVIKNVRTIVIPRHDEQTYTTEWSYDTWNRLTSMTYADGEKIAYTYNAGGLLRSMAGLKKGRDYNYVKQLGYDKFEQRAFLAYGNGTKTTYNYEADRRRLKNMVAKTTAGRTMMDNVYTYDKVNNILSLKNNAPIPSNNLMGGSSEYSYEYDDLYRLTEAQGSFKGANDQQTYNMSMAYNSVGGITQKTQNHERKGNVQKKTSYDLTYTYSSEQPHAPVHIGEQTYTYDANGNQTGWTDDKTGQRRQVLWDEENRIRSIYDNGNANHYIYDAGGERVLKGKSNGQTIYVNGQAKASSGGMGNYTVYVNPYLVLRSGGYTKHYYIEGQRIVSKLGGGWDNSQAPASAGNGKVNYPKKHDDMVSGIVKNLKFLGEDGQILTAGKSDKVPPGQLNGKGNGNGGGTSTDESFQYYYHPDHLGSTSYVTDASGEVYQHLEYFAFGETFVEEHSNTNRTPYLYNGKELDEETGLYYYGARYYDPRTSVWQSVDPLSDKYPSISAYQYTGNNPITYIDPNGKEIIGVTYDKTTGKYSYSEEAIKNGTNKYIEARTQTDRGRNAISGLMKSKTKYSIYVTDKILVTDAGDGKYGLSGGEADIKTSTLVVSTNTTSYDAINGTVKAVALKDGKLVDVDINQANLVKPLDDPESDYARAYKNSGMEEFEKNNPYRDDKERINGTGAHEEVHLTPYGSGESVYENEGRAFTTERKNRADYIKEVFKEEIK